VRRESDERRLAPIGAVIATAAIATSMEENDGTFYSTDGWHPRRVAAAIATLGDVRSERAALRTRLTVGGRVARLVAHDPRLPREIWGRCTGFTDLVRAYGRFERRVAALSNRFVEQVLGGRAADL